MFEENVVDAVSNSGDSSTMAMDGMEGLEDPCRLSKSRLWGGWDKNHSYKGKNFTKTKTKTDEEKLNILYLSSKLSKHWLLTPALILTNFRITLVWNWSQDITAWVPENT